MMLRMKRLLIWLFVLSTTITPGLNYFHSENSTYLNEFVHRQYGNAITINIFTMSLFIYLMLRMRKLRIPRDPVIYFLLFSIISLIFPNGKDMSLALVGIYCIIRYTIFYVFLISDYSANELRSYLSEAFRGVLVFESILGFLQVFAGLKIPFISSWSTDSYRNGLVRMAGSFSSGPEFGLFINIILVFILCEYLFDKKPGSLKYILLATIDVWFSGNRTMIILLAVIFVYLAWMKNRRTRLLLIFGISCFAAFFINTSTFRELFVENSMVNMFVTRLVHWRVGVTIFSQNIFMGVGLNNSVSYLQNNADILTRAYSVLALERTGFYLINPIHNSFLIMFAELGIVGGIIFAYILISPLIEKIIIIKRTRIFTAESMIILCEMLVFVAYGLQGWGMLKEFSWIMMILILALNRRLTVESKAEKILR